MNCRWFQLGCSAVAAVSALAGCRPTAPPSGPPSESSASSAAATGPASVASSGPSSTHDTPLETAPNPPPVAAAGQRSPVLAPLAAPRPIDVLQRTPLYQFNEREVDVYLRHLSRAEPDPIERVVHLARKNIGQPYELFLLGEFPYETYDSDPMYCLSKSDCVTFSEQTYAMALSRDWPSFFQLLQRLRYRAGRVGMLTRNHETLCDWNRNNAWLFTDMTKSLGGGKQWTGMEVVWRPSRFFSQFGIGQDLPDVKMTDAYIPRKNIPAILRDLKDGDFVNVIRGNSGGEWCGHVGLIVHGTGGEVRLLHAAEPAAREQPLMEYVNRGATIRGLKFLRLKANPQRVVDEELAARGVAAR